MSRGITLKGAAAGAFVEAMMGRPARSNYDKYMRIATFIHMEMKRGNAAGERNARNIIESLIKEGLDKTLESLTGAESIDLSEPITVEHIPPTRRRAPKPR